MKPTMTWRPLLFSALSLTAVLAHAQSDVQALADRWAEAYNRHDREALGAVYTDQARLMMHGSPTIEGREQIEAFWADDFEVDNPLTLLNVTQNVVGTDMLLVHGNYRVVNRDSGAQLGFGRFAHLWTRNDGGEWRLDRDLWNQPYEAYDATASDNEVQALADRWTEAYNMLDRDALAAVYTEDAYLMMHGAPTIAGQDAIGDFWATDFEENNPLTLLTVTHAVNGIDVILVHGDYEVVNREDGSRLGFGRFAHIWNDAGNGEWRLDRDMWVQRFEPYPF